MKKVKCYFCGYKWNTKSEMYMVSCPKCMKKIIINKAELERVRKINLKGIVVGGESGINGLVKE